MPDTTDPTTAMDTVVANLRSSVVQAQADIGSTWSLTDTDASTNALAMMNTNIDTLDTTIRARVDDGEIQFSDWLAIAQQDLEAIRAYDSNVTDYTAGSAWSFTVAETGKQLKQYFQAAAKEVTKDTWPVLLLLCIALFLVLAIKVT